MPQGHSDRGERAQGLHSNTPEGNTKIRGTLHPSQRIHHLLTFGTEPAQLLEQRAADLLAHGPIEAFCVLLLWHANKRVVKGDYRPLRRVRSME
jgi:hypothetical protein